MLLMFSWDIRQTSQLSNDRQTQQQRLLQEQQLRLQEQQLQLERLQRQQQELHHQWTLSEAEKSSNKFSFPAVELNGRDKTTNNNGTTLAQKKAQVAQSSDEALSASLLDTSSLPEHSELAKELDEMIQSQCWISVRALAMEQALLWEELRMKRILAAWASATPRRGPERRRQQGIDTSNQTVSAAGVPLRTLGDDLLEALKPVLQWDVTGGTSQPVARRARDMSGNRNGMSMSLSSPRFAATPAASPIDSTWKHTAASFVAPPPPPPPVGRSSWRSSLHRSLLTLQGELADRQGLRSSPAWTTFFMYTVSALPMLATAYFRWASCICSRRWSRARAASQTFLASCQRAGRPSATWSTTKLES